MPQCINSKSLNADVCMVNKIMTKLICEAKFSVILFYSIFFI